MATASMVACSSTPAADAVAAVPLKLVQRLREEFEEAPGLRLTIGEAARYWGLDEATCARVLRTLSSNGFLIKGADGRYRESM